MSEFPCSLIGFQRQFPDEAACAGWLIARRWPNGFACPACKCTRAWYLKTKFVTLDRACERNGVLS